MKSALVMIAIVIMFATSSNAQTTTTFTSTAGPSAFGVDPIIRITSVFKTTVAMTDGQAIPDAKAQEAGAPGTLSNG